MGCVLGVAHGNALLDSRLTEACSGTEVNLSGVVASLPERDEMPDGVIRQRFELVADGLQPPDCGGPRRLSLSYYGDEHMAPGEAWRFRAVLKKPWGLANPGGFDVQAWFARRGIDAVARVPAKRVPTRLAHHTGPRYLHHRLRQSVGEAIHALPGEPEIRGILRAVAIGDKSGISFHTERLFQQFGISHLLVVSGLHVGLVAGLGYLLGGGVQRILRGRGGWSASVPALSAFLLATAYALLAGFSLPAQRVLCMLLPFLLAPLLGRQSLVTHNLLIAAVAVQLLNPLATTGSGFWLSFGAVAALLWLSGWQRQRGKLRGALTTHAYMAVVMLPLGGWFFGAGSLAAMLANILMIPLVGLFVVPLALLGAFSHLAGVPVAGLLWQAAAWPLAALLPLAEQLAVLSDGVLYTPVHGGAAAMMLGAAAALLWALPLSPSDRILTAALLLPLMLAPADAAPGRSGEGLRVRVLDVGQGTSVVVSAGERALVYDTGGGMPEGRSLADSVLLPYLRSQGVRRLDTLVISHPDLDHSAGVRDVMGVLPVDRVRYGGTSVLSPPVGLPCRAGESWRWPGGHVFRMLSPALETNLSSNNSSCVLQIISGDFRVLLPGDIDARREREVVRFWREEAASQLLLAAHHGSNSSTAHALLKYAQACIAVISSGYLNRFGHPHPAVVERLERHQVMLLNTADTGAQLFTPVQDGVETTLHRLNYRRYWM
ncbi:MAG: DNA internalization-related competence protein ComEC/Rec2 [Halioglobus sp.]|nr:DNA internalization-related competence protein ComEC/Rec2 [Halioglobus sp.]